MMDWNEYQEQIVATIKKMAGVSPEVVKGFLAVDQAPAKSARLDAKLRELIAIAVAVTTRCDGCITFHTDAALKAGATKEEVVEVLGVAISLNAGAAMVYSTRALDAFEAKEGRAKSGA